MGLQKSAICEMMFSALLGRQILRRHQFGRRGAAMDAAQVAALGDFPEDQPRLVFLLAAGWALPFACCHYVFLPLLCGTTAHFYDSTIGF